MIIAVYTKNHKKPINTLCGQNSQLLNVKVVVHIVSTVLYRVNPQVSGWRWKSGGPEATQTTRCYQPGGKTGLWPEVWPTTAGWHCSGCSSRRPSRPEGSRHRRLPTGPWGGHNTKFTSSLTKISLPGVGNMKTVPLLQTSEHLTVVPIHNIKLTSGTQKFPVP
jgi:hypothetical protein